MIDPHLTPTERTALEWALKSERKGGGGWHRQSVDGERAASILAAGLTRNDGDETILNHAFRDMERRAG